VGQFAIQFAKAKGARVLTTVSTENVEFARSLGATVRTQRFEDEASDVDMVLDLIDGKRVSVRGSSSRKAVHSFRR
jgi:NADPH:quinone reductase-like Zn-dependent oxidoreductase